MFRRTTWAYESDAHKDKHFTSECEGLPHSKHFSFFADRGIGTKLSSPKTMTNLRQDRERTQNGYSPPKDQPRFEP